jgi:hypothetical protein
MKSSILMFADDIKIWRRIVDKEDADNLQDDLNQLQAGSDRLQLQFNPDKCKVMHIGHKLETKYSLRDKDKLIELQETREEKDLGMWVTADLKPARQCTAAAAKARSVLGMVYRHFKKLDKAQFLNIYKTYVRPHLEYCVQVWSPWFQKDIDCLESVQRRATKMVTGLKQLSYQQRLDCLGLTTLAERRRRGDLLETFKIMKGKENIDCRKFFKMDPNVHGVRGNSLRIFTPSVRTTLRKSFFSQRVLRSWNGLTQQAVDSDTLNAFKSQLDIISEDGGV